MSTVNPIQDLIGWMQSNTNNLVFSIIAIVVGYFVYKFTVRQITRLKERQRLEEDLAFSLSRIAKWLLILFSLAVILSQFGVTLGVITGLFGLVGGTIIGFASINTIGNAIAGLIVMINRPFGVGDRLSYKGQFVDVEKIEIIYTKMRTLDNVLISIPNQELLKTEIENFGLKKAVRRSVSITPGYQYDSKEVENALLTAATVVPGVLHEPKSYVWITKFLSYAIEYTLYVYVSDIKRIQYIDADLHRTVLSTVKQHRIDIRTPLLLQHIQKHPDTHESLNRGVDDV
jgi:small-conductance mechanosensitive channel